MPTVNEVNCAIFGGSKLVFERVGKDDIGMLVRLSELFTKIGSESAIVKL
jgi:hypothetical protein